MHSSAVRTQNLKLAWRIMYRKIRIMMPRQSVYLIARSQSQKLTQYASPSVSIIVEPPRDQKLESTTSHPIGLQFANIRRVIRQQKASDHATRN